MALIGAGKYGAMFLAQARTTEGMHVAAVADLRVGRIRDQLRSACRPETQYGAPDVEAALHTGGTFLTDDADALIRALGIGVVIEAAGDPRTGIRLALACIAAGKHVVMVNVEADFSGLELGVSVAWAAPMRQPTGAPVCFNADVVAIAKRDLRRGEMLDGGGGFCVWGRQVPAAFFPGEGLLPLGLAQPVALVRDVATGDASCWTGVSVDETDAAVRFRRVMEAQFSMSRETTTKSEAT